MHIHASLLGHDTEKYKKYAETNKSDVEGSIYKKMPMIFFLWTYQNTDSV